MLQQRAHPITRALHLPVPPLAPSPSIPLHSPPFPSFVLHHSPSPTFHSFHSPLSSSFLLLPHAAFPLLLHLLSRPFPSLIYPEAATLAFLYAPTTSTCSWSRHLATSPPRTPCQDEQGACTLQEDRDCQGGELGREGKLECGVL